MEIRVSIPERKVPDQTKQITELAKSFKDSQNRALIEEIKMLSKIISSIGKKNIDLSPLEKRLSLIERTLGKIPESIGKRDKVLFNSIPKVDNGSLKEAIQASTNRIVRAMGTKDESEVSTAIGRIERKLRKFSLPPTIITMEPRTQIVPSPS